MNAAPNQTSDPIDKVKPKFLRKKLGPLWWLCLAAGLVPVGSGPAIAVAPEVDIRRDATVAAIERVMPSVVNIRTSKLVRRNDYYETIFRRFYGLRDDAPPKEEINSVGSGVLIDEVGEEGYILTNLHVVQRAERVQVQLWDGREYEAVPLLWTSQKDLALLKIVRKPGDKPFQPVAMAQDDDLLLGETVIAIGNPFGLGGAVTRGILSSKNRRATDAHTPLDVQDWLQTDADINPGNSGGALINLRGELIGINVAVYAQEEGKGTGFAIPVKQISTALSDFFTLEWTAKLWLGARFRGAPHPLTVREVQPGSPAERGGLRIGQQVVEVNGRPVKGLGDFNYLAGQDADRRVALTVLDNGNRRSLTVELVPLPELNRQLVLKRLGLTTTVLTEAKAASYQLDAGEGLLVETVEKNSPAASAQLQPGMVVTAIGGVKVDDLVNIANVLGNRKSGDRLQLTIVVVNRHSSGPAQLLSGRVELAVR